MPERKAMTAPLAQVEEIVEGADPQEQMLQWTQNPDGRSVTDADLPSILATAFASYQAQHVEMTLRVVAFRALHDGEEIARVGPRLMPDSLTDLTAMSVIVTVADASGLHVDAYTLSAESHGLANPPARES
jgi:hypothetical protein